MYICANRKSKPNCINRAFIVCKRVVRVLAPWRFDVRFGAPQRPCRRADGGGRRVPTQPRRSRRGGAGGGGAVRARGHRRDLFSKVVQTEHASEDALVDDLTSTTPSLLYPLPVGKRDAASWIEWKPCNEC